MGVMGLGRQSEMESAWKHSQMTSSPRCRAAVSAHGHIYLRELM
jgi:hypothetical protein